MVEGIDISDYQTVTSFHDVKAAGIGFVVCKATQGTNNVQSTFADYQSRIKSVDGLVFGAYHFMDWDADPTAQANHFLSVYTPVKGDLPPMLDCEEITVDPADATDRIAEFLSVVEPHLNGKRMLLYMDWATIRYQEIITDDFSGHPLWLAWPGTQNTPPRTWASATIWQYTGEAGAPVPGIVEGTDRDRTLGDDFQSLRLT